MSIRHFQMKTIATALILSQFASIASFAGVNTNSSTVSPEETLLANTIALRALPEQEQNGELTQVLNNYLSQSSDEGRDQRFQRALVDLNILTPSKAERYVQQSHAATSKIGQESAETTAQSLMQVAQASLEGAQFSGKCVESKAGTGLIVAGIAGVIAGMILMPSNCDAMDTTPGVTDVDCSGKTISQSKIQSDIQRNNDGKIAFGVAGGILALGITLLVRGNCDSQ